MSNHQPVSIYQTYVVGYFRLNEASTYNLPFPTSHSERQITDEFLKIMEFVEKYLASPEQDPKPDRCRFCHGFIGNIEYELFLPEIDQKLVWTQGLKHYFLEHNVAPSFIFQNLIHHAHEKHGPGVDIENFDPPILNIRLREKMHKNENPNTLFIE